MKTALNLKIEPVLKEDLKAISGIYEKSLNSYVVDLIKKDIKNKSGLLEDYKKLKNGIKS
ncbi:hypothetical protein [Methanobrevibacter arboriphilus]|uniref:hypothetical protein n=1 Tax=Methanobrevibacter arboriphilus TaxID=39441 RepID=UPI000B0C743D|nr:hypothetical protein [Methanobrevibacter arboriphilus]